MIQVKVVKYIIGIAFWLGGLWGMYSCEAAGITNDRTLLQADYWLSKIQEPEKVLMNVAQIDSYNRALAAVCPTLYRLEAYPNEISGSELQAQLSDSTGLPDSVYLNGVPMTVSQRAAIEAEVDQTAIAPRTIVRYGVTVRHTNLRMLPFKQGIFESPDDTHFDILQETTLDIGEPVVILHRSRSGGYYFVQARNYRGWVQAVDIGLLERKLWQDIVEPTQFIVVTARNFYVNLPEERVLCQMGSRLNLIGESAAGYTVMLPRRDGNGQFYEIPYTISRTADVSRGYLPYTRANLLKEAFRFYGAPYGWGGFGESEDCSGLIADVYKTVGIFLPRNADEQEAAFGVRYDLAGMTTLERRQFIGDHLQPGDGLYMDGHAMLYLGMIGTEPYIIHILGSHTVHYDDNSAEKVRVMKAVISDLNLKNRRNFAYIDLLRCGVSFQ